MAESDEKELIEQYYDGNHFDVKLAIAKAVKEVLLKITSADILDQAELVKKIAELELKNEELTIDVIRLNEKLH